MAGVGSLSNANFHMYEPSPIETQLASINPLTNPNAPNLLASYRAQREASQDDYASQLQWTRQQQLAEFAQKSQNDRMTQLANFIKEGATPGAMAALKSAGAVPREVDTSALEAGGEAAAAAKNMSETLSGAGRAAQGNINVQAILDRLAPGSQQGPNAQIESARINSAGRIAAEGARAAGRTAAIPATSESASYDPITGEVSPRISINKGGKLTPEIIDDFKNRVNGSQVRTGMLAGRGAKPQGTTQLQPASNDAADVAPFANNTPQRPGARATGTALNGPIAPVPANSATSPAADPRAQALLKFQQNNPQAWADVAARVKQKQPAFEAVGNQLRLVGASGQRYPLQ